MLRAAWPRTTDAPIRTQGPAAASYPKHNFPASPKIFTSATAASWLGAPLLKQRSLSRTGGWGPGHGNVYVRWKLTAPSDPPESRTTSRRRCVRPSPRLTSHLRGRKIKKKKTLLHRREAPQLCLACSSDVRQQRAGCSRGWDLNYIASCWPKWTGPRGACAWAQVLPLQR